MSIWYCEVCAEHGKRMSGRRRYVGHDVFAVFCPAHEEGWRRDRAIRRKRRKASLARLKRAGLIAAALAAVALGAWAWLAWS